MNSYVLTRHFHPQLMCNQFYDVVSQHRLKFRYFSMANHNRMSGVWGTFVGRRSCTGVLYMCHRGWIEAMRGDYTAYHNDNYSNFRPKYQVKLQLWVVEMS